MEEQKISWIEFEHLSLLLANKIVKNVGKKYFSCIYTCSVDGLFLAHQLSYYMDVPIVLDSNFLKEDANILAVDVCLDSGQLLSKISNNPIPFVYLAVLFVSKDRRLLTYYVEDYNNQKLVFPWYEKIDSQIYEEYLKIGYKHE